MSVTTDIAWCDHTASPWFGCTQVDPCCANCYAMEMTLRYGWAGWGDDAPRARSKGFSDNVHKWNDRAGREGVRRKIFPSLMDWLDGKVPILWITDFLYSIYCAPNLDWLLLTKRPHNCREALAKALHFACFHASQYMGGLGKGFMTWLDEWAQNNPPENVWVGFTAGTRKTWVGRNAIAWDIPAKVIWCSAEPLLERLDFADIMQDEECKASHPLNWIVIGGESGSKRRPGAGVEGIEFLARQAKALKVPVFVKQDFSAKPGQQGRISDEVWAWKEFPQ